MYLTVDGQVGIAVRSDDIVRVKKAGSCVEPSTRRMSYFESSAEAEVG